MLRFVAQRPSEADSLRLKPKHRKAVFGKEIIMSNLVVIGFESEIEAFDMRAELAKLQKNI